MEDRNETRDAAREPRRQEAALEVAEVEMLRFSWHDTKLREDGGLIGCGAPQKMKEENLQQPSLDPEPLFINSSVVERWIL